MAKKKSVIHAFMDKTVHTTIKDPEDETILQWSRLRSSNEIRKESGQFQVEGVRAVEWFLNYLDLEITSIIISTEEVHRRTSDMQLRTTQVLQKAINKKIPVIDVNREVFRKLSDVNKPRGLMIIVKNNIVKLEDLIDKIKVQKGVAIATVGINDPGNMGTIIRSGIAFKASALFALQGSVDPYSPKVLRASTGHFLPAIRHEHWKDFAGQCKANNIKIIALDSSVEEGADTIFSTDLKELGRLKDEAMVLCIGSEGNGFPPQVKNDFDRVFQIPMAEKAESLNAAVAASIALWYLRR